MFPSGKPLLWLLAQHWSGFYLAGSLTRELGDALRGKQVWDRVSSNLQAPLWPGELHFLPGWLSPVGSRELLQ